LIVVYGDHTPVLSKFTAGTITYDPSTDQEEEVPLFIKLPGNTIAPRQYPKQGNHTDIMPTVLDLLGIKTDQLMFGQSLFSNENNGLESCPDQIKVFIKLGDCVTGLEAEKTKSSTIIRYNQFKNIDN
jgi:phosphoglycerol transferase MdoB-like AlkP superfamily enzyme